MSAKSQISVVDIVRPEVLQKLASHSGPSLSIFIPTARHGPETRQSAQRLRKLLRSVSDELSGEFGAETAAKLSDAVETLVQNDDMWQHQSDGLAIFVTPSELLSFRLPVAFTESVMVNNRFRLLPLLGYLNSDEAFYVLALAQNSVRIFEASRQRINELPNDLLPLSMEDALKHEDPERQLQSQSVGGTDVRFHGHGAGKELDKQALERYFRAVDQGLIELLGPTNLPIVLACVDYYLPIYQSVTKLPNVLSEAITGNPEHRSATELHTGALAVVAPLHEKRTAETAERFTRQVGTGNTMSELTQITEMATQGRIDTLLLASIDQTSDDKNTGVQIDNAIADAIASGAKIAVVDPELLLGGTMVAILRH
jgi:hypothetical protein